MARMLALTATRGTWKSGSDYVCCNRHSAHGDGKRRSRHRLRQIERRQMRQARDDEQATCTCHAALSTFDEPFCLMCDNDYADLCSWCVA
jgi:hypothetical protein